MPSIEQSRRQVKAGLNKQTSEVDHDAILASLESEIDKHNNIRNDVEQSMRKHRKENQIGQDSVPSVRFRFKEGISKPTKRKHRSRDDRADRKHKSRRSHPSDTKTFKGPETAHPFPREPTERPDVNLDSQAAFRESLFDALADDEGALYWEGVYSQPIHIYERPSLKNENGELEQMDDNEYAAYVQAKMWERKHPEIVQERQTRERAHQKEREEKERRKAEFVRRKERAAWERAQGWLPDSDDENSSRARKRNKDEYEFVGDTNSVSEREERAARYAAAWCAYLEAWEKLRQDIRAQHDESSSRKHKHKILASDSLPWPVANGRSVTKANTEDFLRNAPRDQAHPLSGILKRERVRWHPDKVQQLFGGDIDADTTKLVTGVFQVIDELYEKDRKANDR